MQHICDNLLKEGQIEIVEELPFQEPEYQPKFDATDPRALAGKKTGEEE